MVVDPTAPYLCCSPDAIVIEVTDQGTSYGILECKCIYADTKTTWDELIAARENFCLERNQDDLQLRLDHPYYYQLIVLLGILDLSWIDICVLKGNDVHIQRFTPNEAVWCTIKQKLFTFYFKFLLPEIMGKC